MGIIPLKNDKKIISSFLLKINTTTAPSWPRMCRACQRHNAALSLPSPSPYLLEKGKKCRLTSHNPYSRNLLKYQKLLSSFLKTNKNHSQNTGFHLTRNCQHLNITLIAFVFVNIFRPGVEYQFSITTQSYNLKSKTKQSNIRTQPLCTSELIIINKQEVFIYYVVVTFEFDTRHIVVKHRNIGIPCLVFLFVILEKT